MNLKKIYEKIKQDPVLTATVATLLSTTIAGIWGAFTGKINKQTILNVVEFIKSISTYKVPIIWIIVSNLIILIIVTMYFNNKKKNILESEIVDNKSSKIDIKVDTNTTINGKKDIKENNCEGFKDYLINKFSLFTYEEVQFKLSYKIESNKVLIDNIKPICSSCSCDLYTSSGYLGQPDDGIDIVKLTCPECKCDEFEFGYTEYNELIDKCNYVLNNKLKHKEKEYEEYEKNLEIFLDF